MIIGYRPLPFLLYSVIPRIKCQAFFDFSSQRLKTASTLHPRSKETGLSGIGDFCKAFDQGVAVAIDPANNVAIQQGGEAITTLTSYWLPKKLGLKPRPSRTALDVVQ
ncbi:hypothetical protein [Moorena producens]|uniref:hypothetical protein n=1 Tax=Moorena producens TaxID=1155739 RepID=UPI003C728B80